MTDPTPPPLPSSPPPLLPGGYMPIWRDQRKVDADHLRLLWIFHTVFAALGLVGIAFLGMHYMMMNTMLANPKIWQQGGRNAPPFDPTAFFGAFKWFYLFMGGTILVGMVLNAVSGWCIAQRKARIFSMVVAGVNCLQIPFGTALGIFTLLVLGRDSVRWTYAEAQPTATPPAPTG